MGCPARVPGTEDGPRKQIRPVSTDDADIMNRTFPARGPSCLVTQQRRYAGPPEFAYLLSWSGWPDLNRRPLRPEGRAVRTQPSPVQRLLADRCALESTSVHVRPGALSLS